MNQIWLLLLHVMTSTMMIESRQRKTLISYPLSPIVLHTHNYSSNIQKNMLTCFGNKQYKSPSLLQVFMCMFSLPTLSSTSLSGYKFDYCINSYGSRKVRVYSNVSTEIYRVNRLPVDRSVEAQLSVTRWLQMLPSEVVKADPAEPLFLCARSNEWRVAEITGNLVVEFRDAALRQSDLAASRRKLLYHLVAMCLISSVAVIPYLASAVASFLVFQRGLNYFILIVAVSCFVISLTPLMLMRTNRLKVYHYIRHHFSRNNARDTDKIIKQKLPLFQAIYFASFVVCLGSFISLICFLYLGVDRETRNTLIRVSFAAAASLLTFFICQSLERFFNQWFWLFVAVTLARSLERHLNPLSRDKALVVALLWSFLLKLVLPAFLKLIGVSRALRFVTSTSVRLGLSAVLQKLRRRRTITPTTSATRELMPREPAEEPYDGFFETSGVEIIGQEDIDEIAHDLGLELDRDDNDMPLPSPHRTPTPTPTQDAAAAATLEILDFSFSKEEIDAGDADLDLDLDGAVLGGMDGEEGEYGGEGERIRIRDELEDVRAGVEAGHAAIASLEATQHRVAALIAQLNAEQKIFEERMCKLEEKFAVADKM